MKTLNRVAHTVLGNNHRHGSIIDKTRGRFSNLTKEAMSIEGDIVDAAKKRGGELLESAQEKGQQAWKGTSKWIQKNPGSAVGAAFVLGVVLKALFGSGRKEE